MIELQFDRGLASGTQSIQINPVPIYKGICLVNSFPKHRSMFRDFKTFHLFVYIYWGILESRPLCKNVKNNPIWGII